MDGAGNIVTDIETGKLVPINLPDYYLGLQTSWEVDVWGKLKNRKKAALARLLATAEGKNLILTNLIAEVAAAYYDLLADDQILRVLDQTILLQEQAIELVRVQKQAATVNELAVQQFEAQLLAMRNMRVEVQQQIINSEATINILAGRFGSPIPRDSGFYALNALPQVAEGVPSQLLANRPDIRAAEAELVAANADLKAARAAFLPSLNITGSLGVQAYRPGLLFTLPESLAYGLFAGITGPILNRANIKGEFGKANAMQQEAMLNYQKHLTQAFSEVYREMKRITSLEEMYEMKLQETSILASSVQVSSELFRTGRANYLEVLIARQNTLRSNMELINTRKNQFIATVNLYKALGGGWR
jgi:NodT family efflux transporter outer membrane factor (OMF) lipoprotein